LSSTSDYAPDTNQLVTNYSFITHSLALSLALKHHQTAGFIAKLTQRLARVLG
jgi:hypothetical protein